MDVPKYKLNASVRGILAQDYEKFVRGAGSKGQSLKVKIEFNIKKNTPIMYANTLTAEEKLNRKRENTLCQKCQGSGYKGRVGVMNFFFLIEKFKQEYHKAN